MTYKDLSRQIRAMGNKEQAKILQRFFKTGKGEYGEGDIFVGIKVPPLRAFAAKNIDADFDIIQQLLNSGIHEERMIGSFILVLKYKKAKKDEALREKIVEFYLKNTKRFNNWDLVDLSCQYILGDYFFERDRAILFKLVESENLWEKRISIITTLPFIKKGDFGTTFILAKALLNDGHDLIHKAVGWMLREIGKVDINAERDFLDEYAELMPRTALRYAIEKFPEKLRKQYLAVKKKN